MECETAVNNLLNSIQTSDIEVDTVGEICPSFFQTGDKFYSFQEVQNAIRNAQNKTGVQYYTLESRKIKTLKNGVGFTINQALSYRAIKYVCVQGGKFRLRSTVPYKRRSSTLKNGCPAYVKFGISYDQQYLEVKSCNDVHNHEISKIRTKRSVCDVLASQGIELPVRPILNENNSKHTQTQETECQDDVAENNSNEPVSVETDDKIVFMRSRADKAVEDLVIEKKRSNDLKEKLLEESRKRNNYLEALLSTNDLTVGLLEESCTRNKYLEAYLKINCLRNNQSFEEVMQD